MAKTHKTLEEKIDLILEKSEKIDAIFEKTEKIDEIFEKSKKIDGIVKTLDRHSELLNRQEKILDGHGTHIVNIETHLKDVQERTMRIETKQDDLMLTADKITKQQETNETEIKVVRGLYQTLSSHVGLT